MRLQTCRFRRESPPVRRRRRVHFGDGPLAVVIVSYYGGVMRTHLGLVLTLLLVIAQQGSAQYWGEQVLEKSFEQTDFFFTPTDVNPYGIGSFKSAAPGLIRDPLLDIIINPALLGLDSTRSAYLYTDFRSAREIQTPGYTVMPLWNAEARVTSGAIGYFPNIYLNTRRELEPVFTGAMFGRPLPSSARDLIIGATYQLILQDDKYYSIPQDIYRSVLGYDYAGRASAAESSIPIVDRYSGQDNMHQVGNFVTGFARYALPEGLEAGVKLSRVMFNRAGAYGSSNLWQNSPSVQGSSYWSNMESRDQSYSHWEAGAGIEFPLNAQTTIGVVGGYLWGDATQALSDDESSNYQYGSGTGNSFYMSQGATREQWRHHGNTAYYGFDGTSSVTPTATVTLYYQHRKTSVDIGLNSNILDTSYSTYAWINNGVSVNSLSNSYLSDTRMGSGTQTVSVDRIMAAVNWEMSAKTRLSIGALLEWQNSTVNTKEVVLLVGRSAYLWSDGSSNEQYGQGESKELFWTFSADRSSLQIPVIVRIQSSESVELLFGLNRVMSEWKIDDVTLAMFRYRMTMTNGAISSQVNFGERYTDPPEDVSDVRTTFLAGLTLSPSPHLKIRLLMVPNFEDTYNGSELSQLQWWIGVNVVP